MFERNIQYINGNNLPITWGVDNFAINPGPEPVDGNAFSSKDFVTIVITAVGTGTILVHGSTQYNPPDFSAASTILNSHALMVTADYSLPATFYAGATGIVVAGGATKIVEVNTNMLTWFALSRSANTVDAIITVVDNL